MFSYGAGADFDVVCLNLNDWTDSASFFLEISLDLSSSGGDWLLSLLLELNLDEINNLDLTNDRDIKPA